MSGVGGLFGRRYLIGLGTTVRPDLALYGNAAVQNRAAPTPLRCEFDIEKGSQSSPNKGTVRICNIADKTRAALQIGMLVKVFAGYVGQVGLLFVGGVAKCQTKREGPDIVTELECGDGESAIVDTMFDRSYKAGTTLAQVLTDVATAMQGKSAANPFGQSSGIMLGVPQKVFSRGYAAHGPARQTMQQLCRAYGLEWSLQNGALQIVPVRAHTGETAEVLSRTTGLLGVPSFDGKVMRAQALINPRLAPGRLVRVDSKQVSGFFKMRGGKWRGDSHGDAWTVDIEAVPMPNVQQALVVSPGLPLRATPP